MAELWIKMRVCLHEHPKVVRMAYASDAYGRTHAVRVAAVVGLLHRTWSLADGVSVDGILVGYTPEALDAMMQVEGWTAQLAAVGWARVTPDGIELCGYTSHNGATAKRRAQEADRQRTVRKTVRKASAREASVERALSNSHSLSLSPSDSLSEGEPEREAARDGTATQPTAEAPTDRQGSVAWFVDAIGAGGDPEPGGEPARNTAQARAVPGDAEAPAVGTPLGRAVAKCVEPPTPLVLAAARAWDDHAREKGNPMTEHAWRVQLAAAAKDPAAWIAKVQDNLTHNTWTLKDQPTAGAGKGRRSTHQEAQQRRAAKAASEWDEPELAETVRRMTTKIGDRSE